MPSLDCWLSACWYIRAMKKPVQVQGWHRPPATNNCRLSATAGLPPDCTVSGLDRCLMLHYHLDQASKRMRRSLWSEVERSFKYVIK